MVKKIITAILILSVLHPVLGCLKKDGAPPPPSGEEYEEHQEQGEHKEQGEHGKEAGTTKEVHLTKEVLESLNVEFGEASIRPVYQEINATGKVIRDTDKMTFVFSTSGGVVKKILVKVGQQVKQGQALLQISGYTLRAPKKGTVLSINTSLGSSVSIMDPLVTIADIDLVRVIFDVYPKDMDNVAIGQKAEVTLIGHAEHGFPGTIQYLSPNLDEVSQTLKVGADVQNIDHHLKFGMFVQGKIYHALKGKELVVPEAALVRLDEGFAVFVPGDEEGSFVLRPVKIGGRAMGTVEILEGLKPGAKVVTKGSFTLKSEFLRGSMGEGHAH